MRQKITIWVDTPENSSLFDSVQLYANELGKFYQTSARFEIQASRPMLNKYDQRVTQGTSANVGQESTSSGLSNIGTSSNVDKAGWHAERMRYTR